MQNHQQNLKAIMQQTNINDEQVVRQAYFDNNKDIAATIVKLLGVATNCHADSTDESTRTDEQKHFEKMRMILDQKDTFFENIKTQINQ